MKAELMLAKAILKASDTCYTVPGYPVTRLGELTNAEFTINEKVALEYALGDSLSGRRSAVIVKNAGMNTLSDTLVNATVQGLKAGVVIIAGDDTEPRGSQNRQDSRYYSEVAQVPVIGPGTKDISSSVELAYEASEKFSRVSILRVTPDILSSDVSGEIPDRKDSFANTAGNDLTMKGRCDLADNITAEMFEWSHPPVIYPPPKKSEYVKISEEKGRPFSEEHKNLKPPKVTKNPETFKSRGFSRTLCKNCPYKELFSMISGSGKKAICDTGCSLLSKNPPYGFGTANYGLGSSPAVAAKSTKIALTGDYALLHSGINALIDIKEKNLPLLCIVLKNKKMGMTGMQNAPDIMPYISWADPLIIPAGSPEKVLKYLREGTEFLKIIVVEGECPPGEEHEAIKC
ncbi:indolepyruvate ferredoxin oxidoreductase [Methanoplanus sp. FWC-SCC4]|uniref:Indolepyruvate ferredoxin oxidoreductase n=1 Tax=Methanochimaera problematica TaxID=2609417 RepID=A0AA97I3J4_9EURY|nr:thiamine pyrophosphate-dependent enzyme [Methanoplanus sp. FWC-SCC4]WOF15286.1 indolepyruvate ferredoxin oxidoreductase [Methanoplanus sp. FWC-SCC4]